MRGRRTRSPMRLTGTVSSGLGRAQVFMSQEHYQTQFKSILENEAWPGTLNVKVDGNDLSTYVALRSLSGVDTLDITDEIKSDSERVDLSGTRAIRIRGFLREGRSFGGATAFHATIQTDEKELPCAILIPDLTRHVDVVEVISTEFLRQTLSISDGDIVSLNLR
jgi:riboflavin kinase